MAITASTIIGKVEYDLNDTANDRWAEAEHLANLNEAQRMIVALKPDAYTVNDSYQLAASETKQRIPDGSATYQNASAETLKAGVAFIDAVRNMGTSGTSAGAAVDVVEKNVMDSLDPDWHTATASETVETVVFDRRDPKVFYVYPPQVAATMGYLQIVYSALPDNVAAVGNNIVLDDIYELPIMEYMKYRAYAKNSHYSAHAENMRRFHWNQFVNMLGRKELAENYTEPPESKVQ